MTDAPVKREESEEAVGRDVGREARDEQDTAALLPVMHRRACAHAKTTPALLHDVVSALREMPCWHTRRARQCRRSMVLESVAAKRLKRRWGVAKRAELQR
jgi:hypothetical protein